MPVSKFHELRYNVALILKEMNNLEKRSILQIQDWETKCAAAEKTAPIFPDDLRNKGLWAGGQHVITATCWLDYLNVYSDVTEDRAMRHTLCVYVYYI